MEEEEDDRLEEDEDFDEHQDQDDHSRPTTPKWWRPPIPPETYLWEEIRRKRQRGGYPWTYLDRHEDSG
ncbi:unnamed protein product [Allacma fusca]|nr:unnamed protein product [Allacma fusca]